MTSILKIRIKDLTPQFLKDLRERFGDKELEIKIADSNKTKQMEEALFWEIIAHLDWSKENNEEILAPAVEKLAAQPFHIIYQFEDILSKKLYDLDGKRFAAQIGEDAWQKDKYFSVDNFLYARCCVIANGREAYENVIKNPKDMPKDLTFEPLLTLASKAYFLKTGKPFNYLPLYNFLTYGFYPRGNRDRKRNFNSKKKPPPNPEGSSTI